MKELNQYYSAIDYIREQDKDRDPSSIALEYIGKNNTSNKITRNEYWSYVNKYRQYFYKLGIEKQEPVTICMENCPEYEFIYVSLLENGSIDSTVGITFLCADFNHQTVDKGVNTLILSVGFLPNIIKSKALDQMLNNPKNKRLKRIIFTSPGDYRTPEEESEYNSQDFKSLIDQLNIPSDIEIIYPGEMKKDIEKMSVIELPRLYLMNDIATYSNTGGTTGAPKCAYHNHMAVTSLLHSHDKSIFKEFNMKENSRSLLVIPISHITSQFYALLIRRAHGADIIYNTNAFEADALREIILTQEIDDMVAPFGLYYAITREPFEKGSLKLNTPVCGGEPTPLSSTIDVNEKLHAGGAESLIIGTGSTEFASGVMATYGIENRTNESGYFFPFSKGVLIDPKTGNEITEEGKRGILYINTPWQMTGYLNNEKATNDFFCYKGEDGTVYGTNNDIVEITGEHDGKAVYSMLGRSSDFIITDNNKTYYPGAEIKKGMVQPTDFEAGYFMFDLRDTLLNINGVMEVQPVIVPESQNSKEGYPVVNITINKDVLPENIIREAYKLFHEHHICIPSGLIFRTHFARSLSNDKREVLSLAEDRTGYYYVDEDDNIYCVEFPINAEPIRTILDGKINVVEPPAPKMLHSRSINKK